MTAGPEQRAERIAAELENRIGERTETAIGPIDRVSVARFAAATGDEDPEYRADTTGRPVPLPPLFLSSIREWGGGSSESELRVDGTSGHDVGLVDGAQVLGGGQELTFLGEVVVGEPLTVTATLTSAELKRGRGGLLVVESVHRRFATDSGRVVLDCHESRVLR